MLRERESVWKLLPERKIMTLCPIALAAGCVKCPFVKLCPLKEILGDYKKDGNGQKEPEVEEEAH